MNHNEHGLLNSKIREHLDLGGTCYDPQHCVYVNWISNNEFCLFIGRCVEPFKTQREMKVHTALQNVAASRWEWPAALSRKNPKKILKDTLREKRLQNSTSLKADASEILILYPILRFLRRLVWMALAWNRRGRR